MKPITYTLVESGSDDCRRMQNFANSFSHEICPSPYMQLYEFSREDTTFGYSEHTKVPTVYPAFHPSLTHPRDVMQVMSDWRAHTMIQHGVGYIAIPFASERESFPESMMNKLGLQRMRREIYKTN
tara:strand:- start:24100 stop:24477 length:378 start_codon:yes stop_codon:yes gene_type:complete